MGPVFGGSGSTTCHLLQWSVTYNTATHTDIANIRVFVDPNLTHGIGDTASTYIKRSTTRTGLLGNLSDGSSQHSRREVWLDSGCWVVHWKYTWMPRDQNNIPHPVHWHLLHVLILRSTAFLEVVTNQHGQHSTVDTKSSSWMKVIISPIASVRSAEMTRSHLRFMVLAETMNSYTSVDH